MEETEGRDGEEEYITSLASQINKDMSDARLTAPVELEDTEILNHERLETTKPRGRKQCFD